MNRSESIARRARTCTALAAATVLLTLSAGCAPTALVNVWRDPSIAAPRLNRVLVIALRKDGAPADMGGRVRRRAVEVRRGRDPVVSALPQGGTGHRADAGVPGKG